MMIVTRHGEAEVVLTPKGQEQARSVANKVAQVDGFDPKRLAVLASMAPRALDHAEIMANIWGLRRGMVMQTSALGDLRGNMHTSIEPEDIQAELLHLVGNMPIIALVTHNSVIDKLHWMLRALKVDVRAPLSVTHGETLVANLRTGQSQTIFP